MKYDFVSCFASQTNANVIIRENHSNEVCHLEITKLSAIKKLFSLTQEHSKIQENLTSLGLVLLGANNCFQKLQMFQQQLLKQKAASCASDVCNELGNFCINKAKGLFDLNGFRVSIEMLFPIQESIHRNVPRSLKQQPDCLCTNNEGKRYTLYL